MQKNSKLGSCRSAAFALLLALPLLAVGCAPKKPPSEPPGPARNVGSDAASREHVAITVYNQDFGVVRERRRVDLGTGRIELAYADVAAKLQPETVHIRSLADARSLSVLEQNYRFDLLTPETLLKKYVGKRIKVYRYNEKLGTEEEKAADVLAVENGVVLRIDGQVTYGFPGRFAFPEVPANLVAKPTLVWLLDSRAPKQDLEVSYVTRGIGWKADYVLSIDADDVSGDLTGWVTLANDSGTTYENAELKLVAGDVQRVEPPPPPPMAVEDAAMDVAESAAPQFRQEGLFEYHLYSLQRPTTIRDKEQKQVSLLEARGIRITKKLLFFGERGYFLARIDRPITSQKIGVYVDFENERQNQLGVPLPEGVVRVYKADRSGAKQFVGEDRIEHTPRDEKIRIKLGEAFDVVAERKQMRHSVLGSCASDSEWEISLRNHKDVAETVEVWEPTAGDWEVVTSSHPARREDAHTFVFEAKVPARGETKVSYRVRVRWC